MRNRSARRAFVSMLAIAVLGVPRLRGDSPAMENRKAGATVDGALAEADGPDFYMTSTELTVARLSSVLGRLDHAVEYFERARGTLERHGRRVLRAIVDYDEALARADHKQPGAARLLAVASLRFQELGMREWSRRAAHFKLTDDELPDRLTAREAEILRLVAYRRTNKEIAAELVLSVHTVERHVQNAYRKIGARSRADAGTYVTRVGL